MVSYAQQGTGYDSRATGHEMQGRASAPKGLRHYNQTQLVADLARRSDVPQTFAAAMLQNTLALIEEALRRGDKVKLREFGAFRLHARKARAGVDPRNGSLLTIKPALRVKFSASPLLNDRMGPPRG